MKNLNLLYNALLLDCGRICGTTTTLDISYVQRRIEDEGLSFLSITLGTFGQDFEKSLDLGYIGSSTFVGFRKLANAATIPKLFSGMLVQVFDLDGKLLSQPSILAIRSIRQLCRFARKVEVPCTPSRVAHALDGYAKLEEEMSRRSDVDLRCPILHRVSSVLWQNVLSDITDMISDRSLIPRHGRGKVAQKGVLPNQKYVWTEWPSSFDSIFPLDSYCYYSSGVDRGLFDAISLLDPGAEHSVRIVTVPKTLKGPRVIGIEPTYMQYAQQSVLIPLVSCLEKHPWTRQHINFADQSINGRLALESSKSGLMATLDLSEASDRVSLDLVKAIFRDCPLFLEAILTCRSTKSTLGDGRTFVLSKFASMGSALCFPIESMVFFTLLIYSEIKRRKLAPSTMNVRIVARSLYVYGDDLIIPVEGVPSAIMTLEAFGLKVNTHKSFWNGKFRESCGVDAYDGIDITPVYMTHMPPDSRHSQRLVVSYIQLSNRLYKKGYFRSAEYIREWVHSNVGPQPVVRDTSACIGWIRDDESLTVHKWDKDLQSPLVKGFVLSPRYSTDTIDGEVALTKWFLEGLNPREDAYAKSVCSGDITVKRRWKKPY